MVDVDTQAVTVYVSGRIDDVAAGFAAAATSIQSIDAAKLASDEFNFMLGQVEQLAAMVEAALPARHEVARRFWAATDELTELREPIDDVLRDALDAFDTLPLDERRHILNGWLPAERRPSYRELTTVGNVSASRVMELSPASGRYSGAVCDYRLDDDAGVHPMRVLLTEGVSKRQVLDGLRAAVELVVNDWEKLVASGVPDGHSIPAADDWFHGPRNKKGDASPLPTVPELAGNRNDKGAEAKPADL